MSMQTAATNDTSIPSQNYVELIRILSLMTINMFCSNKQEKYLLITPHILKKI